MSSIKSQHHLSCSCTYQTMAISGEVLNKTNIKSADLVLGRNDYGALVLFVNGGKIKDTFLLNSFTVHKKFLNEGKASITFPQKKVRLMIFNSPFERLFEFLKLLYVKNEVEKEIPKVLKPLKQQALLSLKTTFSEVSPLGLKDLNVVNNIRQKNIAKCTNTFIAGQVKRKAEVTPSNNKNNSMVSIKNICTSLNENSVPSKESLKPQAKRQLKMSNQTSFSSVSSSMSTLVLSSEQVHILEAVNSGKNLFITGSAGTGKSFILNKIIRSSPPDTTYVTASTGLAACHIKGTTIHSFAGIGTGKGSVDDCVKLASRPNIKSQWKQCRLLIIDEVSMIQGDYFEKLEATARMIRKNERAFGGVQLVLCGDFLQLPPICKGGQVKQYAFQSNAWERCKLQCEKLRQVHRQEDASFVTLLNRIRLGICTDDMERVLRATDNISPTQNHGIVPTKLCTHKEDVDRINQQQLAKLTSAVKKFTSTDNPPSASVTLNSLCPAPHSLTLMIGAQVMITKNVNVAGGLVNGARGVVVALQSKENGAPVVRLLSGVEHAIQTDKWVVMGVGGSIMSRKQLPLKLAWALSIHKSQGMTLDYVEMSLSKVFEAGQAYVALSRARSLKGLRVVDFNKNCIRADPDVIQFYKRLR